MTNEGVLRDIEYARTSVFSLGKDIDFKIAVLDLLREICLRLPETYTGTDNG